MVVGIWGAPSETGYSVESIESYVSHIAEHGITDLYLHLKGGDGLLYWPSKQFSGSIAPGCEDFDYPAEILKACKKHGVRVHAWMIDFFDGGQVWEEHPEWAMRNKDNGISRDEPLRGSTWGCIWQCPARRPGYTDQRLVPVYEEFARLYDFDGIHHDYVRYPGDAAPDEYCFCDFCLEDMAKFNGFVNECNPDESYFHEKYDRTYLEAHWEQSPRVLPMNWDSLPRRFKADFYRNGSFFAGGKYDLNYFFYTYRTYMIERFVRETAEAVRRHRPKMDISAAIFKNPIHSGRFIGQDWRKFAPWVDTAIPMDYRDHFPGTFEDYLMLLTETIGRQKTWTTDFKKLYIGIAINFLFKEEEGDSTFPAIKLERAICTIQEAGAEGLVMFCDSQLREFGMWPTVKEVSKSLR